jgi:anti-sigma-K factor RskA
MAMTCDRVRELAPGFVLGALEADEMIAVQDHLDGCSEAHPEVDEFGGVLPYIAQTLTPVEPPAWLRESVIAAAKADSLARKRVGKGSEHRMAEHVPMAATEAEPALEPSAVTRGNVISLRSKIWARRGRIATWTTRVAAAVLVFSLAGYAWTVQGELNKAHSTSGPGNFVIGRDTQQALLTSTTVGSKARGAVFLQPTGHMALGVNHLEATAGDQAYVVWATPQNGAVYKIGWFTVDASGWAFLEYDNVPTSPSLWVFICIEPNGGVTKPTGPIVLSGTLST